MASSTANSFKDYGHCNNNGQHVIITRRFSGQLVNAQGLYEKQNSTNWEKFYVSYICDQIDNTAKIVFSTYLLVTIADFKRQPKSTIFIV